MEEKDILGTLDRLRRECRDALRAWAIFEAANGYPTSNQAQQLHDDINAKNEGWGISEIQRIIGRDIVIALGRMTDRPRQNGNNNRQSLGSIGAYLERSHTLDVIIEEARRWPTASPEQNESVVRQLYAELVNRLAYRDNGIRNLMRIRVSIAEMRNKQIAHALEGNPVTTPTMYEIRDALVFCVVMTKKSSLIISGTNWDPNFQWNQALREAKRFWQRYHNGFGTEEL